MRSEVTSVEYALREISNATVIRDKLIEIGNNPTVTDGICENLRKALYRSADNCNGSYLVIKRHWELWPEYSGDDIYPIKSPLGTTPRHIYLTTNNLWDKSNAYGEARHKLVEFLISSISRDLELLKGLEGFTYEQVTEFLIRLTMLKTYGPTSPENGICANVEFSDNKNKLLLSMLIYRWPLRSGSLSYPVPPSGEFESASSAFNYSRDMWSGSAEYSKSRLALLDFLIAQAEDIKAAMERTYRY